MHAPTADHAPTSAGMTSAAPTSAVKAAAPDAAPDAVGPAEAALLSALGRIDLTSADGRAGLHSLLAELERRAPAALLRQAAILDLRRVGCVVASDVRAA